ncbi:ubiquitin carboxyl-terminal hydrolase 29-like [Melanotaenia boesemani]|uniref:ubiquitin carboxyl-terminal hydrolase 29-like n=1 Tax=Melanotaenia boesemani TaxID=1250792 RepID=UPI001C05ABE2|nr:ubiquitin carboxyl-terminal hydrolase 29-like [Melanotaenia boesemani]
MNSHKKEKAASDGKIKESRNAGDKRVRFTTEMVRSLEKPENNREKFNVHPTDGATSIMSQQVLCPGFPNPARSCYMNSSLQTLLTLKEFVEDVRSQEDLFGQCHEAELMKCFMNIVRCHNSDNALLKLHILNKFKRVISAKAPEFEDAGNKDAHEFLTAVLDQMDSLALPLHQTAAIVGGNYTCPIARNFAFEMQNTRTCKRCGDQSITQENFTSLSLDLISELSVQQLLQMYQMETQLEYMCDCGGTTSGRETTFLTLPKYLILHLKRFKFTEDLQMMKLHDPIILLKELMMTSHQDEGWYSLVSVISHLGSSYDDGHYVSDGLHPYEDQDNNAERWLHYDDVNVYYNTGDNAREACKNTSYVLFYQRRV